MHGGQGNHPTQVIRLGQFPTSTMARTCGSLGGNTAITSHSKFDATHCPAKAAHLTAGRPSGMCPRNKSHSQPPQVATVQHTTRPRGVAKAKARVRNAKANAGALVTKWRGRPPTLRSLDKGSCPPTESRQLGAEAASHRDPSQGTNAKQLRKPRAPILF